MEMKLVIIISIFLLQACGSIDTAPNPGSQGPMGVPGQDGQTPFIEFIRIENNLPQCPSHSGIILNSTVKGIFGSKIVVSSSYICDGV